MKISIVIPAYNEEKYLARTLQSIQNQSIAPDEVIVVDNNSTDKTAAIAKEFGATVVHEKQQGNVFALKKALDSATCEIIASTDADSQLPKDWIKNSKILFADDTIVCATGYAWIDSPSVVNNFLAFVGYALFLLVTFGIGKPNVSGFCLVVRKSAYQKSGGIDTRYLISSDVDLGLRLKKYGSVILAASLTATTSARRWKKGAHKEFLLYTKSYFSTVWLRKPYGVAQKPIR